MNRIPRIWLPRIKHVLLIYFLMLYLTSCVSVAKDNYKLLYFTDNKDRMYLNVAAEFINEIFDRNLNGVLEFVGPPGTPMRDEWEKEPREELIEMLFNGNKQSVFSVLKNACELEYVILPYGKIGRNKFRNYLMDCFDLIVYDKCKINSLRGLAFDKLREIVKANNLLVISFLYPSADAEVPEKLRERWIIESTGHPLLFYNPYTETDLRSLQFIFYDKHSMIINRIH